jgi:predicted Zn-dependent protease
LSSSDKMTALVFDSPEILETLRTNAAHSPIGEQAERAMRKLREQPLANFGYWGAIVGVLVLLAVGGYFSLDLATAFAVAHVDPRFETEIGRMAADKGKWDEHSQYMPRLQKIGQKLTANLDTCPFKFTFHIQRDKSINAMAYPGGTVVVYTGLLEKASDDELAGVLGHEFGHVIHHDSLRQVIHNTGLVSVLSLISGLGQESAEQVVNALSMAQQLESLRYGRSQEAAADLVGVDLATKSGYKGDALITFFARLKKETGEANNNKYLEIISTHPMDDSRIAAVKAEVERLRKAGTDAKRDPSVKP